MRLRVPLLALTTAAMMALGGLVATPASAVSDTSTWTGLGADNKWSTADNWDIVPTSGSKLVFPDLPDAARHVTVNDFFSGTSFSSITIRDSGYEIGGEGFRSTTVVADHPGTSKITAAFQLDATTTVTVAGAGTLEIASTVSGDRPLTKSGTGTLLLARANS